MKRNKKRVFTKANVIKSTRGAVSLFLAMLMVPFTTLVGALLTAARVNSASTIFDEVISVSADSTLAEWDSFLKSRFGLLAMKQDTTDQSSDTGGGGFRGEDSSAEEDNTINSVFSKYVNNNISVLSNTFFDVETNCTGLYSLADTDILKNQILEYSKLTVPTVLAYNALDIDGIIKSLENLIPGKNWLGLISSTVSIGSTFIDLGTAFENLLDAVKEKQTAKSFYDTSYSDFESSVSALSAKIAEKNRTLAQCDQDISSQKSVVSSKQATYDTLSAQSTSNDSMISTLTAKKEALDELLEEIDETIKNRTIVCGNSEDLMKSVNEAIDKKYLDKIDDLENMQLDELRKIVDEKATETKNSLNSLSASNSRVDRQCASAKKELQSAQSTLSNLQTERANKEAEYNSAIDTLKQTAGTEKSEYVEYIGDLISKLNTEKTKITAWNSAKASMVSSCMDLGNSAVATVTASEQDKLKKESEKNEKSVYEYQKKLSEGTIDKETYENYKTYVKYQNEMIDNAKASGKNMETMYNAVSNTISDAIKAGENELSKFNEQYYDAVVAQLSNLKKSVSEFDIESVGENFNRGNFKSNYYINLTVLTEKMVNDAQDDILEELVKDSLWETVKLMFNALKSFIKMLQLYDPNLNSVIDTDYYSSIKSGWTSSTVNMVDKNNSIEFKKLFGTYTVSDSNADNGVDLLGSILTLYNDVEYIYSKVSGINLIKTLLDFGKSYKAIEEKLADIKQQMSNIVDGFSNLIPTLYANTLVTGYLSYSTSCRTNYSSGTSLTGESFNLRKQSTSYAEDYQNASGISDFINMFSKAFTGNTAKCFVGAEQEYLINGKDNEIQNQLLTFLEIYLLRAFCDIIPIITNAEVNAMAAACGPFCWLVWLLEMLLDPLIDTFILTSGGSVALWKNQPYLTISGIGSLVEAVGNITLSNATLTSAKDEAITDLNKLSADLGEKGFSADPTANSEVKSNLNFEIKQKITSSKTFEYERQFFKWNYQNYLFLYMCFCSQDTLISRFRDIVEYEAVQKLVVDNKNVFYTDSNKNSGVFDLAKSYTYLRCEASFSTNEFIKLSGNNVNMKTRVLYRGY